MWRLVLLCLALFVGSVSAWGNWFSKNRQTECGKFKTNRWGWFFEESVTDVDTRRLLADIKQFDTDRDGYLTFAEAFNPENYRRIYAPLDIQAGYSRCESVKVDTEVYGFDKEVANTMFSLTDSNGDFKIDLQDMTQEGFNSVDTNGDGRVSICEYFQSFMDFTALTEKQVYLRQLKYKNLVYKFRKNTWFSWW